MFHDRQILSSKAMYFSFFVAPGFQFQNHLNFQGLQHFLRMKFLYYEDLVRVFYTNLKITHISDLSIEICSNLIHIRQMDWMNILQISCMMPEEVNFDRALTLSSMILEDVQGQNVRNAGSLNMNDKLLHYTWVHMLCPRDRNFTQLLNEDIFMLWCIKNDIIINWPCSVMQKRGTFTHAARSTSTFIAPICDCREFAILRTPTTEKKNVRKRFWGCPKYNVKFIQLGLMQT